MHSDDIVVVGAGPAGLAVSACLRRKGLQHTVLEREDEIGATWRRHYDRLHLHTTKTCSGLPMTPWPKGTPRYPSRDAFLKYLQDYASTHHIAPRFGVAVESLSRQEKCLIINTSAGPMTPRFVIMATGYNAIPSMPVIPGLLGFCGVTCHSSIYKNAGSYKGKRTLVVGCGNSGAEIALDLAENNVDVAMVVRGPAHVIPRDIFGCPTQHINLLLSYLPLALQDAIATATVRLVVGDLSRWGIVRPTVGPNRGIEQFGRIPLLDLGTVAMIKKGKIRVLPGVEEILAFGVRFAGGQMQPFDSIIFATGYTSGLSKLIEGFDAISDSRGRPHRFGQESGIAGLYFVGFRNPPTGALREIAIEATRVARAICYDIGVGEVVVKVSSTVLR